METKNEALIARLCVVSDRITHGDVGIDSVEAVNEAAALLRSQASEIERLKAQVDSALNCSENANKLSTECLRERDQLKAKNEKLAEALRHIAWSRPPGETSKAVELLETLAIKALKENT